jgi:hypothetical protein
LDDFIKENTNNKTLYFVNRWLNFITASDIL